MPLSQVHLLLHKGKEEENEQKTKKIQENEKRRSHIAARGVRRKEFGKKVTKKVTEASEKVTERVPKTKKSNRTPFADLLLRHPKEAKKQNKKIGEVPSNLNPIYTNPTNNFPIRGAGKGGEG